MVGYCQTGPLLGNAPPRTTPGRSPATRPMLGIESAAKTRPTGVHRSGTLEVVGPLVGPPPSGGSEKVTPISLKTSRITR